MQFPKRLSKSATATWLLLLGCGGGIVTSPDAEVAPPAGDQTANQEREPQSPAPAPPTDKRLSCAEDPMAEAGACQAPAEPVDWSGQSLDPEGEEAKRDESEDDEALSASAAASEDSGAAVADAAASSPTETSAVKKREPVEYPVKECRRLLTSPTAEGLAKIACSNCIDWMSDRSGPRRAMLRALHPNCTDKRIGSTARRASALYKAACGGESASTVRDLAGKLRYNYRGRSRMYRRCWNTTKNSFDTTISVGGSL